MPIVPYAKESKLSNGTLNANTALESSANESIEGKIVVDAIVNKTNLVGEATITSDEKRMKNLTNVFRDIDAKKIQSNAKDIEDESKNILQSRRNTQVELSTTSTTSSTTTAAAPPPTTTNSSSDSIPLSSANDASTLTSTNTTPKAIESTTIPQTNEPNVANVEAETELSSQQQRHRRHRQQR